MPLQLALWEQWENSGDSADYVLVEKHWNFCDLGFREELNLTELRNQGILHWSGPYKPWHSNGPHREVWMPYLEDVKRAEVESNCSKLFNCPRLEKDLSKSGSMCGFRNVDCIDGGGSNLIITDSR